MEGKCWPDRSGLVSACQHISNILRFVKGGTKREFFFGLYRFWAAFWRDWILIWVGLSNTLIEYICSPTRYTKCFNEWVYSALMLARHVSDLIGPSSGAFCTSCVCRFGMWQYAYYSTRPAWTCRVVRTAVPHTISANRACTKRSWWWTGEVRNMLS